MSDPANLAGNPFETPIQQYRALSDAHAKTARGYSFSISLLIAFGLFVVIALPYALSMADKAFGGAQSANAVEDRITDVERRIDETLLSLPPYLTIPIYSRAADDDPLYFPGLKPLWPATQAPSGVWIAGGDEGQLLISDPKGENWEKQTTNTTGALWPPLFATPTDAIISGAQGALLESTDGGRSWAPVVTPMTHDLNPPVIGPSSIVVVTGSRGTVLLRESPENAWISVENLPDQDLESAVFNVDQTGIITGASGTLLLSENGGRSWDPVSLPVVDHLVSVLSHEQSWLITGDNGALLWSTDGRVWQRVITTTDQPLNQPFITQSGTAIVTGKKGLLLQSDSTWQQWTPQQLPIDSDLHPPVQTEMGMLVISGEDGALFTSSDNGGQWINHSLSVRVDLNPPVFFGTTGLISGDEGTLLLSSNSGRSWIPVNTYTPSDLNTPVRSPEGDLFVAGDDGTLLLSSDQGRSWQDLKTGIPTDLQPPVFHDDSLGTLSSYGGLYQLIDITDLLDEDRLTLLVERLEESTQPTTANTLEQLEEQKRLLEDYKATLNEFDKSELNDQLEKSLVRVSALAVIMFLVQVLITNYRYSIKLSDYYLARAQGLAVVRDLGPDRLSADDITALLNAFTPATDFGKQVDTPIDKVMTLTEKFKRG